MIEIKNIVFTNYEMNFIKCLLCFINYLLPLRLKYANESFVALEDNINQALITLDKDSKSYSRFKITKLILEENSQSTAHQLINYVIARYRAMGASSFYVVIDEKINNLESTYSALIGENKAIDTKCRTYYTFDVYEEPTNHKAVVSDVTVEYSDGRVLTFCFFKENGIGRFTWCCMSDGSFDEKLIEKFNQVIFDDK